MKYIKRAMEDVFVRLNNQFPAILITGPRQVGKTTMLLKLLEHENKGRKYVSLDDLSVRAMAHFSLLRLKNLRHLMYG